MIRNSLILLILLAACTPEKGTDTAPDVTLTIEKHYKKDWNYTPCNGTTPNCGRLE